MASLLPQGKQYYETSAGVPLVGGKVYTYDAGTTNPRVTYQDAAGTQPNANPVILDSRGEATIFWSGTYKVVLKDSLDVTIWTQDNITSPFTLTDLTRQVIGLIFYPRTSGEIAASVTPTNYYYVPGAVDRYGTNTTPGTTDMVTAFNNAFAVAKQTGCSVQWGATAPYRLNGPVNCTLMRGVVAYDFSSKNLSSGTDPSIIVAHTGHGFDLSASTEMTFHDVVAMNLSGTVPKSLFFMARNAAGSGAGIHRLNNCRTVFGARFTSIIYNYGSEENCYNDCSFYNSEPSSVICNHTTTNTAGYSSSFLTIATGAQSNVTHRYRGCTFYQFGNSGSTNEVVIQIEGASDFSFVDGAFYCPHGVAYVRWIGTLPSADIAFSNVRGETDGSGFSTQGYLVATTTTTGVNSHNNWTFINCRANAANQFLFLNDAAQIINLTLTNCASTSGLLLSVYLMSNSTIIHSTSIVSGRAGGTVSSSTFIGVRSNVLLSGTDTANCGFDQTNGRVWETGDTYTAPSTACTGAITTSVVWSLTKFNKKVTVSLPAIAATATAATSFAFGAVLPAAYRPATTLRIPIIVLDNGGTPNQLGMVFVNSATGAMSVFKDVLATANFSTLAAGEGLPCVTDVSWTI